FSRRRRWNPPGERVRPRQSRRLRYPVMGWRTFLGRGRSGSPAPSFKGPVPAKEFLDATGLTQAHLDRFEGEGLVKLAYVKGAGRMVQNPSEFVSHVMAPMPDTWPPDLPVLDDDLQQRYALGGDQAVA